ncbi:PEP-CTERM sorting domain-containing protein [Candidatus Nitrosacidococcus sp. I8]|uniref:PEP-CTERM sorting domain-containing protein n=1 Tax=Candidatus Nitrosacidococcus sp. I8 TaxID=2942908 RepID=UPI00222796C5|nr:PEP-CTERM sorting domain-containing protein [Candidatus Nitrosacidococcus sp. I8]CAH9019265.1 hypothetical protein NURINAE_01432 [Candidatus Nitrosacidococcus sp. I8]
MIKFLLRLMVGVLATINIAQADIIYHWVPSAPLPGGSPTNKGDIWITGGEITINDDVFETSLNDGYVIGSSTPPISFSINLSSTTMGDSIFSGNTNSLAFPYATDVPLTNAGFEINSLYFGDEILPTTDVTSSLSGVIAFDNVESPTYSIAISPTSNTGNAWSVVIIDPDHPKGIGGTSLGSFVSNVPEPNTLLLFSLGVFGFITLSRLKQEPI